MSWSECASAVFNPNLEFRQSLGKSIRVLLDILEVVVALDMLLDELVARNRLGRNFAIGLRVEKELLKAETRVIAAGGSSRDSCALLLWGGVIMNWSVFGCGSLGTSRTSLPQNEPCDKSSDQETRKETADSSTYYCSRGHQARWLILLGLYCARRGWGRCWCNTWKSVGSPASRCGRRSTRAQRQSR